MGKRRSNALALASFPSRARTLPPANACTRRGPARLASYAAAAQASSTFKTLDGVIKSTDPSTGRKTSMSHKCGELDKQVA